MLTITYFVPANGQTYTVMAEQATIILLVQAFAADGMTQVLAIVAA